MDLRTLQYCERCVLCKHRLNVVLPKGNPLVADIMFIADAPGRKEDREGSPFAGSTGELFATILRHLKLPLEKCYITNVIKCRPTTYDGQTRVPTEQEIKVCAEWLKQEIELIKPRVLVLMGAVALGVFFRGNKMANVAGQELLGHGVTDRFGTRVFVLHSPAVLLKECSAGYREEYNQHVKALRTLIK